MDGLLLFVPLSDESEPTPNAYGGTLFLPQIHDVYHILARKITHLGPRLDTHSMNLQDFSAVILALLVSCSFLSFYTPVFAFFSGSVRISPERVLAALKGDPFNVTTKEEDFLDGQQTRSSGPFWAQIYKLKIVLVLFQAVIICAWIHEIIYPCQPRLCSSLSIFAKETYLAFAAYTLVITITSILNKHEKHTGFLAHLCTLLTVKTLLAVIITFLPSSNATSESSSIDTILYSAWNIDLAFTFVSWLVVIGMPRGLPCHYSEQKLYSSKTLSASGKFPEENVSGEGVTSLYGTLFFTYATQVFMLGKSKSLITMDQLPILPASLRAAVNLSEIKYVIQNTKVPFGNLIRPGSGFRLAFQVLRANFGLICILQLVSVLAAIMYYAPIFFIQYFLAYLEEDPDRKNPSWGWFYVGGIFVSHFILVLVNAQLWSMSSNDLRTRLSLQLNTLLYAKTLVRKDLPSSSGGPSGDNHESNTNFSSKAEVMTLMTTDVGRARNWSRLIFSLTDASLGISIGGYMLYTLLGSSTFVGLALGLLLVPLNQLAGKFFLGAIRMIKFMAWERSFEKRVLAVRKRELKFQNRYSFLKCVTVYELLTKDSDSVDIDLVELLGNSIPLVFALGSFWHFAVIRRQELTPAIAFTAIVIFVEIKYPLNELPEFLVEGLQAFVSLKRIEKYLNIEEIDSFPRESSSAVLDVELQSATIAWPRARSINADSTPRSAFSLKGISTAFPKGEISLICGRIGSGKTLLLLGMSTSIFRSVSCPRSAPDSYSFLSEIDNMERWTVEGICAYVPQTPWLRNQTIKENVLFGLPFNAKRYNAVLEACALVHDLKILEDGDESEIGEQGINLSGGQKARVSLARAVYSRASVLLLDDVLSAVDAHTVDHLWQQCFKGELMTDRTVLLVSHHILLCGPDSKHILALENGRVQYSGSWKSFHGSTIMNSILVSSVAEYKAAANDNIQDSVEQIYESSAQSDAVVLSAAQVLQGNGDAESATTIIRTREPRKLVQEETRSEGRISLDVWKLYVQACGNLWFWAPCLSVVLLSCMSPVWENGWLKIWSAAENTSQRAIFYITVYAGIVMFEIFVKIIRWVILFSGSIRASKVLHKKLLEAVLFANIRFHDTVSRGRLLNRFGKDFEAVDNDLSNGLGRTVMIGVSLFISIGSLSYVGGWPFLLASACIITVVYFIAQVFGQVARDLRRLSSITNSPLFGIYGETISGLVVIRAFGMPTKFLTDMIICADTNMNPFYWSLGLHRWLSVRFQLSTGFLLGLVALITFLTPSIDASWAGLALAFASTLTLDMYWFFRRWIDSEQVMIALERIKEYSDLPSEPPEFIEPRPPASWPTSGLIQFEKLSVRYAPELPDVLHELTVEIKPGEKIGLIGRTGSGKSTLGLALMRFVEPREGRILIDGLDTSKMGLTDLRRRLTIIPQDPVLLSGTLRSALDVFGDYDDAEIYEALRRVNLLHDSTSSSVVSQETTPTVFSNLDAPVSELGDNFSTGEKQLLCMARALLRRSKVLLMDEATASVDYATDEIISKTVKEEFADSTIITIAHRLRTVIDYDRVMVMDEGRIVEFDRPGVLIDDEKSRFHKLCSAAGKEEFEKLRALARR
ncbi:hypothetical protein CPB84DRAFT_1848688 [Gymnopilus junonius]|uniref:Uncharacterized protein n=1 Tax=Gymnopilus junonius TaxID=109634 RepID=A0A9P5TKN1_GYMJU|nr:hypothetical protein CPB84DRAFT_1848688 [Gymnopilus junonius]